MVQGNLRGWMHQIYEYFGIGTFQLILIIKIKMILLTDANFNSIQLCFLNFFNWRSPESTICKKPHLQVFWQKNVFFSICEFWGSPIEKIMKAKLNGIRISIS